MNNKEYEMIKIENVLERLSKSKFRASFHLKDKDLDYIDKKGLDIINNHTRDFIYKRLSPAVIPNDGKQTPTKNHPVFIAQHATATCCRKCLYKWHNISMNKELSNEEQCYIIKVIMTWIEREMKP
ncbi:DUF4186 domain-containing protein [Anaerofustis stercorihominis]|uniref:DUF4186 domain-containing protein n=1 Tax=Anaerofustis stercorihominis DSM 17244 TaxID=445971 RepID=B1C9J9_9FIRM|nr:DUF4186 domain-containing protein [Anaerofustis stercorihominis]EDS72570.1 hypothetical protein ANASTE_02298 [Anaerofustis stercorihominis DSM 17244]MCQ4795086.1 DUF4186 domain-containing protein [Anaerofustis stercorihominis]